MVSLPFEDASLNSLNHFILCLLRVTHLAEHIVVLGELLVEVDDVLDHVLLVDSHHFAVLILETVLSCDALPLFLFSCHVGWIIEL